MKYSWFFGHLEKQKNKPKGKPKPPELRQKLLLSISIGLGISAVIWYLLVTQSPSRPVATTFQIDWPETPITSKNAPQLTQLVTFTGNSGVVTDLKFSPDGEQLASLVENTVKLWEFRLGKSQQTTIYEADYLSKMAFRPDSSLIVAGNVSRSEVNIWRIGFAKPFMLLGDVDSLILSSDGTIAAADYDDEVILWNTLHNTQQAVIHSQREFIAGMAFTASGNYFAFSDDGKFDTQDATVRLWNVQAGTEIQSSNPISGFVLGFSPDERLLVRWHGSRTDIWDLQTAASVSHLPIAYSHLVFNPSGTLLATEDNEQIRLWDAYSGEEVFTLGRHISGYRPITFNLSGDLIVTADSGYIYLWDASTGTKIASKEGHLNVERLVFSPDGTLLASANSSGKVILWGIGSE